MVDDGARTLIKHKRLLFYTTLPLCAIRVVASNGLSLQQVGPEPSVEQTEQLPHKEHKMGSTFNRPRIMLGTN